MLAFLFSTVPSVTRSWGCTSTHQVSMHNVLSSAPVSRQLCVAPKCRSKMCATSIDEARSRDDITSTSEDSAPWANSNSGAFMNDQSERIRSNNNSSSYSGYPSSSDEPVLSKPPKRLQPPWLPERPMRATRFDRWNPDSSPDAEDSMDDSDVIYYTRCSKCTAVYDVLPEELGRGKKICCSVCNSVWFQRLERLLVLDEEKQTLVDYPVERKDEFINEAAEIRREARSRADNRRDWDSGERRSSYGYERSNYQDRRSGYGERREFRGNRRRSEFSVFLGNLSYEVTQEDLKDLLQPEFGDIRVTVVKDLESGRSKGFAFCNVDTEEEVENLIMFLDGKELKGRNISARVGRRN